MVFDTETGKESASGGIVVLQELLIPAQYRV